MDGRFGFRRRPARRRRGRPVPRRPPVVAELVAEGRFPDGEVVLRGGARTGERLVIVGGDRGGGHRARRRAGRPRRRAPPGRAGLVHEEVAGRRGGSRPRSFFQARPDGAEALVDRGGRRARRRSRATARRPLRRRRPVRRHRWTVAGAADARRAVAARRWPTPGSTSPTSASRSCGPTSPAGAPARRPRSSPTRRAPGLGRRASAAVAATQAERLALVSCDPAALGRDAGLLPTPGYVLRSRHARRPVPPHVPRRGRVPVRPGATDHPPEAVGAEERAAVATRRRPHHLPATPSSSSPSAATARRPWPRPTAATPARCSPWPAASSSTRRWPRRSCRRCSCGSGTSPEKFDPERGALRSYLLAQCHGRSVDLLRSETSRRRREERDVRRTAEAGYDLEHEVVDLAVAEQVQEALADAARGRAAGDRPGLLRRPHLP